MASAEIEKGRKTYPEFIKGEAPLEKTHQKLTKEVIKAIEPFKVLGRVNNEFLNGRGKLTKKYSDLITFFNLGWTNCYVEMSGHTSHHLITIAFCPFLIKPNYVVKNIDKLIDKDTPKGTVYPAILVLGGTEAKEIGDHLGNNEGLKNIYSLDPEKSTVCKIPRLLGEINKTNLIEGIEPPFEDALKRAYYNSALKERLEIKNLRDVFGA